MKTLITVLAIVSTVALSGCSTMSKRDTGTVVGAVGGGVLGNVITGGSAVGTVAGAAGGAYIGNRVSGK